MPVTLSQFTNDEIDVRYKEEFLSESLNAKMGGGILPIGLHSGYYLTTSGIALSITIVDGSYETEHNAVVSSGGGEFALSLRRSGDLVIDLSAKASTTVAICLYANYTVGGTTSAEIRAYETFPVDELTGAPERSDLVILGKVVVPAAGLITDITAWQRIPAAGALLPGQVLQTSLIKNQAFAFGDVGSSYSLNTPPWETTTSSAADTRWRCSNNNFPPILGTDRYQALEVLAASTPVTLRMEQFVQHPFLLAGGGNAGEQQINIYGLIGLNAAALGGTARIFVQFMNSNGDPTADEASITVPLNGVGFVLINDSVKAPLGGDTYAARVGIEFTGVSWGSTGEQVDVYYLQAQIVEREYFGLTDKDAKDFQPLEVKLGSKIALFDPTALEAALGFSPIPGNAIAMLMTFLAHGTADLNPLLKLLRLDRTDETNSTEGVSLEMRGHIEHLGEADVAQGLRATPAIQTVFAAANPFTLFWESQSSLGPGVSHPSLRIYSSNFGEMWLTSNAYFDPTGPDLWRKDTSGNSNAVVLTNTEGTRILKEGSGLVGTTWATGAWRESVELGDTGNDHMVELGQDWDGSAALNDLVVPRVEALYRNANRTLIFRSTDITASGEGIRIYAGADDFAGAGVSSSHGLELTFNAYYDNDTGLWESDDAGEFSAKWSYNRNNMIIARRGSGAGTWTDAGPEAAGGWDKTVLDLASFSSSSHGFALGGDLNGPGPRSRFRLLLDSTPEMEVPNFRIDFQNRDSTGADIALTSHANPTNPAARNSLTPKQTVKMWARIIVPTAAGIGGACTLDQDFNVSSATAQGILGVFVNLDDQITDTSGNFLDVVCFAQSMSLPLVAYPSPVGSPTNQIIVIFRDSGSVSTLRDMSTLGSVAEFNIMCLSEDTGV